MTEEKDGANDGGDQDCFERDKNIFKILNYVRTYLMLCNLCYSTFVKVLFRLNLFNKFIQLKLAIANTIDKTDPIT